MTFLSDEHNHREETPGISTIEHPSRAILTRAHSPQSIGEAKLSSTLLPTSMT